MLTLFVGAPKSLAPIPGRSVQNFRSLGLGRDSAPSARCRHHGAVSVFSAIHRTSLGGGKKGDDCNGVGAFLS